MYSNSFAVAVVNGYIQPTTAATGATAYSSPGQACACPPARPDKLHFCAKLWGLVSPGKPGAELCRRAASLLCR